MTGAQVDVSGGPEAVRQYRITAEQFRELGRGYGGAGAVATLAEGQLTKRRQLLLGLAGLSAAAGAGRQTGFDDALALMAEASTADPAVAEDVLRHPHFDAWATHCLRAFRAETGPDVPSELNNLAAYAAAAAIRAGVAFEIDVPILGGDVALPTLGAAVGIGNGTAHIAATRSLVRISGSSHTVTVAGWLDSAGSMVAAEACGWIPQRAVTVEPGYAITIDDLDPYRDCYQWQPAPRLSREQLTELRKLLVGAWAIVRRDYPAYAVAIRGSLRSVVPLVSPYPHGAISAASRRAWGAVGVSVPGSAAELALLLIHETQHMRLGALLDLVDLHAVGGRRRYMAPWRLDPRPVGALLQGVYAHASVTEYWRVQRRIAHGARARTSEVEYVYWREQNARAVAALATSDELTGEGKRFVEHLTDSVTSCLTEPVPADIASGVTQMIFAQAVWWRLRNCEPDRSELTRLAAAWRAGERCPPVGSGGLREASPSGPVGAEGIVGLIRLGLVDGAARAREAVSATPADRAVLAGDFAAAAAGYRVVIEGDPCGEAGWVGLALAHHGLDPDGSVACALESRPDLVRAIYQRLRASRAESTPDAVAVWVADGIG